MDAAHFVHGAYLGYLWCIARIVVRTPSGRQRFNVLGALNAVSHQLLTVTNDTYITSESVCDLLRKIKDRGLSIPITVVLDNSRYQRCKKVTEEAVILNIELLFLPPYSPNLNIIERLWKFVKKECLYSKYYDDFASFKKALEICLSETRGHHREALETLLTLTFQIFENITL
jgi:transposase